MNFIVLINGLLLAAARSPIQDVVNRVLAILMPILMALAVATAIIMIAYYGLTGQLNKSSEDRANTIKKIVWVCICMLIVFLASTIALSFKDTIVNLFPNNLG